MSMVPVPKPRPVVVYAPELEDAWTWWKNSITLREALGVDADYIRDSKKFKPPGAALADYMDLFNGSTATCMVARLYMTSLFGHLPSINRMTAGGNAFDVSTLSPLDHDIGVVLNDERRFRNGLSEHLAFWARQADAAAWVARVIDNAVFAMSKPNLQPEDKGHDGLILLFGSTTAIELQSVKNSKSSPRSLLGSKSFRTSGVAGEGAMDDIWRLRNKNHGMNRLEDMTCQAVQSLGLGLDDTARLALTNDFSTNIVGVADAKHDNPSLFDGYEHVGGDKESRIGTFLGARAWVKGAEAVRNEVLQILANRSL